MSNIDTLISGIRKKNKRSISRAISLIEQENNLSINLLNDLFKYTGNAYKIGITGPPGAGKSTLTNELTKLLLKDKKSVGIIAVDPTSPFSGGAILGDRIRMNEIGLNDNVFIRSMATRGSLGGLGKNTIDSGDVIDSAGFDYIIYETVGVGQSELDIAKAADTTIVVLVPESGDSVQAMKAGLMEIADFFVLNKADRPGADAAINSLQSILMFRDHNIHTYLPKIIKTIASQSNGITDLYNEIISHKDYLVKSENLLKKRHENYKSRIKSIVEYNLFEDIWNGNRELLVEQQLKSEDSYKSSPYITAQNIISHYKKEILSNR